MKTICGSENVVVSRLVVNGKQNQTLILKGENWKRITQMAASQHKTGVAIKGQMR